MLLSLNYLWFPSFRTAEEINDTLIGQLLGASLSNKTNIKFIEDYVVPTDLYMTIELLAKAQFIQDLAYYFIKFKN